MVEVGPWPAMAHGSFTEVSLVWKWRFAKTGCFNKVMQPLGHGNTVHDANIPLKPYQCHDSIPFGTFPARKTDVHSCSFYIEPALCLMLLMLDYVAALQL